MAVLAVFASFWSNQPLTSAQADKCKGLGIDSPATHAQKNILQFPIQCRVETNCHHIVTECTTFLLFTSRRGGEAQSLLMGSKRWGRSRAVGSFHHQLRHGGGRPFTQMSQEYGYPLQFNLAASASTGGVLGEAVPLSLLVSSH